MNLVQKIILPFFPFSMKPKLFSEVNKKSKRWLKEEGMKGREA